MESFGNRVRMFLGYSLFFFGLGIMVIGIAIYFDDGKVKNPGLPIAMASTAIWLPGAVLVYMGKKWRARRELMESVVSIIKSYRRITLHSISEKLGISIPEANGLLSDALEEGMIEGNFDRTTDEFYVKDAKDERIEIKFCEHCGAELDKIYYQGDTIVCKSCGSKLS